jgi:GAF domain-containing protein
MRGSADFRRAVAPGSRFGDILDNVVELVHTLTSLPAAVWLASPGGSELTLEASRELPKTVKRTTAVRRGTVGPFEQALSTNLPVHLNLDSNKRLPFAKDLAKAGWRSTSLQAIRYRGRNAGIVQVFSSRQGEPALADGALRRIAETVGMVLENHQRAFESGELSRLIATLAWKPDVQGALKVIVDTARRLTDADSSTILLYDKTLGGFEVARRSPDRERAEGIPRLELELARHVIEAREPVHVEDTQKVDGLEAEPQGVRSLIGVRLELEGERFGVLYGEGRRPRQFTERDIRLLERLAQQASIVLGWTRLLLEPWLLIEQATANLFRMEEILRSFTQRLNQEMGFDFSTVQLVRRDRRVIENFCATGIAQEWVGRSRHYLHRVRAFRDIQAEIVLARPLRTEILSGWDSRFDRGIYEAFHHDKLARIFAPLVVVRSPAGELLEDWTETCSWRVVKDLRTTERQRTVLVFEPQVRGRSEIEVIGTVEVGFNDRRPIEPEVARSVVELAAREAKVIRSAMLRHVQETIVAQARKIAQSSSASLHVHYEPARARYLYEVHSMGDLSRLPKPGALERMAVRDGEVKLLPDPDRRRKSVLLERQRSQLAKLDVRAMAAFPLLGDPGKGVLCLHYTRPHHFRADEIRWLQLLTSQAADAVRFATAYTEIRDRARQLEILQSMVQDLVARVGQSDLIANIARGTLNLLAADVVTLYEYNAKAAKQRFVIPPEITGRLRHPRKMQTRISRGDAPALLVRGGKDLFVGDGENLEEHPVLGRPRRRLGGGQVFVVRESIQSCAAILPRLSGEIMGVLFINYRRPHHFSDDEKQIIHALASATAIAIRNQRVLEQAKGA